MKSQFCCPNCGGDLEREGSSYRCSLGHCFDVAKEGYVHLLPVNQRHSDAPGDDKAMTAARTKFLEGGWYAPLRQAMAAAVKDFSPKGFRLLDAGCGEGYYTAALEQLAEEMEGKICGVDLSKPAVKKAAKRCKQSEIAVASVYHLPVKEESLDGLMNCFSPLAAEEFCRVLRPGGCFYYVVPGPRHLWEMKEVLYETPYENPVREECYPGFVYRDIRRVESHFTLNQEELQALFQMTPYVWKSPKEGITRLKEQEKLDLTCQFALHVFEKIG